MEIQVNSVEEITVIELKGDVDAGTAPKVQESVLSLVKPGCKILLNMLEVPYMSSAGLRVLLSLYRQAAGQEGKLVLVGLSEEIKDTMSITGFLDFFTVIDTVDGGMEFLKA